MTMKISFSDVQAAQRVVADGVHELNGLTRLILGNADASRAAMLAPAGRITADIYTDLGGGGRALAETLAELQRDLATVQQVALAGSDQASHDAAAGAVRAAVTAGM